MKTALQQTVLSLAVCVVLTILSLPTTAQPLQNPVLRGVADAGCIRYAGKYYLGGVGTDGDFYVSQNLTDWKEHIHVFDLDNQWTHGTGARNNQVHGDDIFYSNGLFHLLFSVNYWGNDRHIVHITHATSPTVTGPYCEVRNNQWFENRIDPQVFCDEDGSLYLYMVKFTDGNTIWARPMNRDFSFRGDAVEQFSSLPGSWETCDNRVAEGPFVIKYRGRYYMMYNANHTAAEYGNYHLGVCEAPSPMAFGNGGKYSHPVVSPNTEPIAERFTDLLRYGDKGRNTIDLNKKENHFSLEHLPKGNVYLLLGQTDGSKISINGKPINTGGKAEYAYFPISADMLHTGDNTLTVTNKERPDISHLYLYDMGSEKPDEVLVTPGQPNIVRGPNGWEWWLVYMANQGWGRHQFIDRIHFVGNRLTVDGITGKAEEFHPVPAQPQYTGHSLDSIPNADCFLLELTFSDTGKRQGIRIGGKDILLPDSMERGVSHEWRIEKNHTMLTVWIDRILVADHISIGHSNKKAQWIGNGKTRKVEFISFCEGYDEYGKYFSGWNDARQTADGMCLDRKSSLFKSSPARSYSMSVLFHNPTPDKGRYGLYATYTNEQNYLRVSLDATRQCLITEEMADGKATTSSIPLTESCVHYPDIKYADFIEKQYRFDCPTYISGIAFPHVDAINDTYAAGLSVEKQSKLRYHEDMASRLTLEYLDGDQWKPITCSEAESDNRAWQQVEFPTVKTKALRFINKNPEDYERNIYRIKTIRDFQSDYQLRIEKREGTVHIFVGEREVCTKTVKDTPSRTGIYSDGNAAITVGNTLYYVINA